MLCIIVYFFAPFLYGVLCDREKCPCAKEMSIIIRPITGTINTVCLCHGRTIISVLLVVLLDVNFYPTQGRMSERDGREGKGVGVVGGRRVSKAEQRDCQSEVVVITGELREEQCDKCG